MEEEVTTAPGAEPVAPPGAISSPPEAALATTPTTTEPPNHTIYINNLNEKIKINGLLHSPPPSLHTIPLLITFPRGIDLKSALYALASQYGTVLDIVARNTLKMRGQAFVVFRDVTSAVAAQRALNGKEFFEKPMRVQFARDKSDAIAKLDGSYPERLRARQQQRTQRREEEERAKKAVKRRGASAGKVPATKAQKLATGTAAAAPTTAAAGGGGAAQAVPAVVVPNNMLFVENLPPECDETALTALFVQFPGFREAKLVPAHQGLAFVEFDSEITAGVALTALNGFKVDSTHPMRVTYAKR